jgi:hypothetical protein
MLANSAGADTSPTVWTIDAALVVVDISGYTLLTQRAADEGLVAVERLNSALSEFFSKLIDLVMDADGDIVAFAGDAIFAVFPVRAEGLGDAARRAARCAVSANLVGLELEEAWTTTEIAGCRITVAAGATWVATFPTSAGRRLLLAGGAAYERMAQVHGRQQPGSIAVDAGVVAALGIDASIERRGGVDLLVSLRGVSRPTDLGHGLMPNVTEAQLRSCLPAAIAARLETGHEDWLAEVRHVHALFFSPQWFGPESPDAVVIAKLAGLAQQELIRVGGDLLQVRSDENGFVFIAVFGIPGCTHEDDPARALLAAAAIRAAWRTSGVEMAGGLASGQSLCAVYGNRRRSDYVIMGRAMNVAARLMQQRGGLLAELEMVRKAGAPFPWAARPALRLKGLAREVEVAALSESGGVLAGPGAGRRGKAPARLIGRQQECQRIDRLLEAATSGRQPGLRALLVGGEAGMGKTTLARHALEGARKHGLVALLAGAQQLESRTPYFLWRGLLQQLLTLDQPSSGQLPLARTVRHLLASDAELHPFLSLLDDVVPLDLPASPVTRRMDPSARAAMLTRLVVRLLQSAAPGPMLILVEDAHWLDSASWSVLIQAMQQVDALRLFMTFRPGVADWPDEARQFMARHQDDAVSLSGLSATETAEVVRGRSPEERATPEAIEDIFRRSGGNPFFAEELALSLSDSRPVRQGARPAQGLPVTVAGTVLARVDRLAPRLQHALKVASVLGAVAPLDAILQLASIGADGPLAATEIEEAERHLVADRDLDAGSLVLRFRHAITQEAIYSVLTPSQKADLHGRAALWYEQQHADHLSPVLALLAHHFRAANQPDKAMPYLVRAGEQALQAHANVEAREFLQGALALEENHPIPALERVRRRRLLAEASLRLSKLQECRLVLLDALAIGARPAPTSPLRLCLQIAAALPGHLSPPAQGRLASGTDDGALLAAQLHQLRAEVAYFEHDMLALLHSTFEGLRAARWSGPSREQAITHGTAAIVLGLLRLTRLSRAHLRAAVRVSVEIGHEPTYAYVHHLASVCSSAVGEWAESERTIEVAAQGYRRNGDLYRWQTTRMILAYQALHLGDLKRIDHHLSEIDQRQLFPSGPLQLRAWFKTAELARANEHAMSERASAEQPAQALIDEVLALAAQVDPSQSLLCHGFAAIASLLRGERKLALVQAEIGLHVLRRHRTTTYYSLFGIVSIGDTFLLISEDDPSQWKALRPSVLRLLRVLRELRLMVPIAHPTELLLRARTDRLDSRAVSALLHARRAAQGAERLGMAGIAARAQELLRRWAPAEGGQQEFERRA